MGRTAASARMTSGQRREQLLELAAVEFAAGGLYGASMDELARRAGITQAYVFGLFGTKKALFLAVVDRAFTRLTDGIVAVSATPPAGCGDKHAALEAMGSFYDQALADRTGLLVQLQAFAACSDAEVRDRVRAHLRRMWTVVADRSGLPPVAVKTFLAFGMLLNTSAALELSNLEEEWAAGIRTRIHIGLSTT